MRRAKSAMRSYLVISLLVCVACQGEVIIATTSPEPTTTSSAVSSTTSTFPTTSTTIATTTTSRPTTTSTAQPTTTAPSVASRCEAQPSAELPADATEAVVITGDVDGQEDTVTGYLWQGGSYLHLGLASGWRTSIRVDDQSDPNSTLPLSMPGGVVSMSGDQLIVNQSGGILVGAMYVFFAFRDCALHPVELAGGGLPEIWTGDTPRCSGSPPAVCSLTD